MNAPCRRQAPADLRLPHAAPSLQAATAAKAMAGEMDWMLADGRPCVAADATLWALDLDGGAAVPWRTLPGEVRAYSLGPRSLAVALDDGSLLYGPQRGGPLRGLVPASAAPVVALRPLAPDGLAVLHADAVALYRADDARAAACWALPAPAFKELTALPGRAAVLRCGAGMSLLGLDGSRRELLDLGVPFAAASAVAGSDGGCVVLHDWRSLTAFDGRGTARASCAAADLSGPLLGLADGRVVAVAPRALVSWDASRPAQPPRRVAVTGGPREVNEYSTRRLRAWGRGGVAAEIHLWDSDHGQEQTHVALVDLDGGDAPVHLPLEGRLVGAPRAGVLLAAARPPLPLQDIALVADTPAAPAARPAPFPRGATVEIIAPSPAAPDFPVGTVATVVSGPSGRDESYRVATGWEQYPRWECTSLTLEQATLVDSVAGASTAEAMLAGFPVLELRVELPDVPGMRPGEVGAAVEIWGRPVTGIELDVQYDACDWDRLDLVAAAHLRRLDDRPPPSWLDHYSRRADARAG